MKKFIIAALLIIMCALATGCGNRQVLDITYTFNRAVISLPDGTIVEGPVESWKDYEDGDQLQIVIDGTTYLVHSMNAVLIAG